jgi:hypothetical protein
VRGGGQGGSNGKGPATLLIRLGSIGATALLGLTNHGGPPAAGAGPALSTER